MFTDHIAQIIMIMSKKYKTKRNVYEKTYRVIMNKIRCKKVIDITFKLFYHSDCFNIIDLYDLLIDIFFPKYY